MRNLFIISVLLCSALDVCLSEQQDRIRYHGHHERMGFKSASSKEMQQANDVETRAFPCPEPADIFPCVCIQLGLELYLDCTDVENDLQMAQVFQQPFPLINFYELQLHRSSSLFNLNFTTNGVTFAHFVFAVGPFTIESVTEEFFEDSAGVVQTIGFESCQLTEDSFPFDALSGYPNLYFLDLFNNEIAQMPTIVSDSLTGLVLQDNQISAVEPGSFDGIPNVNEFILEGNQLTEIKAGSFPYVSIITTIDLKFNMIESIEAGSFYDSTSDGSGILTLLLLEGNQLTQLSANTVPITAGTRVINFADNAISEIDELAFYVQSEPALDTVLVNFADNSLTTVEQTVFGPLMPYVNELFLQGNPLECGCDIAWLMSSVYLSKLSDSTTCVDGTPVNQLDPDSILENC